MPHRRAIQRSVAFLLLLAVAGTCGAVDLAAHSATIEWLLGRREYIRFQQDREHYMNRGSFVDFEDRLLIDRIPNGAAERGGMFLLGPSTMKWATADEETPVELRPQFHNFSIGATNHAMQLEFVRFLVEEQRLLDGGADRVHLVLGLYWSMGLDDNVERFWAPLWNRHGVFSYEPERGIMSKPLVPLLRRLLLERARISSFLSGLENRLGREICVALRIPLSSTAKIQDPVRIRRWIEHAEEPSEYESQLVGQMQKLDQLVRYATDRHIDLTFVLLPHREPLRDATIVKSYFQHVKDFSAARSVRLVDLSMLLGEDEFWDINHSNYRGLLKTQNVLMSLARERFGNRGRASTPPE